MTTQKETLQPKDIVGYCPGLKALTSYNDVLEIMGIDFHTHYIQNINNENTFKIEEIKPVLYSLDWVTKEIPFNGTTIVPLIECAKVAFPLVNDFRFKHNFVKSDKAMISFYYEPAINSFLAFEPIMQDINVPKQYALFQLLYQYKIDFLGLIDKGLAVDVSTLENKVYG